MSASAIPPDARSSEQPASSSQPLVQPLRPDHNAHQPPSLTDLPRVRRPPSASHAARGESISMARRAAAVAKKKRERARAQFEQQGLGTSLDTVLRDFVSANASTRPNVSQNKAKRQKRIKWTPQEVEALRCGVHKYGEGRWAVILRENASLFNPVRISVDLKDKWRNLSKSLKTSEKPHNRVPSSPALHSTPTTSTPSASASRVRSGPPLPLSLRSTPGPSIVPTSRISEKLTFPSLPAIQVHRSHEQRSLLNPKRIAPEIVSPMADVRRTHSLPQTHQPDNLPVFGYHQMVRSRPFQESSEPIRGSNLSGFHLHSSPGMTKNHQVESRLMPAPIRLEHRSLVTPSSVSLLVGSGGAPHDNTFARSLEERTLPHAHHNLGPRADHRASEVIQHATAVQPIPTSHPQHFDAVSQAYSSSALHISREPPVVTTASQRTYGINREERLQPVRILGESIHPGHAYRHQPVSQHVVTDSNHFRSPHSLKERNVCEPSNEVYHVPNLESPGQDINSRYSRYVSAQPRSDNQRDIQVQRPSRQSLEEVVRNHRGDDNHPEHTEHRNLRDSELGSRGNPRNNASQSVDDDMHLRSSNSENRFPHHQTEDEQDHYLRAPGNDVQFGSRQGDSDGHQRTSSPPDSGFSQEEENMNRNSLDHNHIGMGGQQQALVQTGECIHNEDSMHQVEVPREVLDNDEDEADDEHITHPHTDPNPSNLYHGNDDEDDQLTSHHPFSLVNPDVEHSDDGEARDDSHTLGLSEPQQGIDLQVRLDEESPDCYVPERPRSPSIDQEHHHQGQHFGAFCARDDKIKTGQLRDITGTERGRHLLGQRRDRGAQRIKPENQNSSNLSRSADTLRFTEHHIPDNCTDHSGVYVARDDENGHPDRLYDKDSDLHQFDSNTRDRSMVGELNELSASGLHSNESEFTRKGDFKEDNNEHGSEGLEGKETRGMLEAGTLMSSRDGARRSSPVSHPANAVLRLQSGNEEDPALDLQNRSSYEGQSDAVNASSSDSSREMIPLVNSANSFKVMRIKPSTQKQEKVVIESQGAAERELQESFRNGHSVPLGRDKGVTQNRKAEIHREGYEENSISGGGRHRVEAGASLANLLNPSSLDGLPRNSTYDRRQQNDGKDAGSRELPAQEESYGGAEPVVDKTKTELE